MMEHGYSLPFAITSVAEAVPVKRKRTGKPNDPRRLWDKRRGKTRVNIGEAFPRWRELRNKLGLQKDAHLAGVLLDSYLRTKSVENRLEPLERSSSTETLQEDLERVHYSHMMSSPNKVERETSVQASENGTFKEPRKEDVFVQRQKNPDKQTATKHPENKENRDIQEDDDQEFSTSLSVGDGRFLVDLGSSSEFIVDEECILQLFKSCRQCNRQCTVTKKVKGLKLVVSQACCFCHSCCNWTNLPSDDDDQDGFI